jgi:hypothetical protein
VFLGNDLKDKGTSFIAAAVRANTFLSKLDLSNNGITVVGVKSLCEGLKSNATLRSLNISGTADIADQDEFASFNIRSVENKIGDEGLKVFASILERNVALQLVAFLGMICF